MELSQIKKKNISIIIILIVLIITGITFYKNYKAEKENPTLVKAEGIKVSLNEVSETLGEKINGPHNSLEFKKLMAPGILKNKLIDKWAKEEGLSTLEYISKIKMKADVQITQEDLSKHLQRNNIDKKKLTPIQLENYKNILIENKRQDFFHSFIDKKISEMKVEQK